MLKALTVNFNINYSLSIIFCFAARQRLPDFMSESPFDGRVTRRVKMAANVIDRFRYLTVFIFP